MSREAHVRFCESLAGRFRRATRRPCAESFFHSLKVEAIHGERFGTREEMRQAVFEYIEVDYNLDRRHSANGYISPAAFEAKQVA
ncbi:IS3 family transposase [Kineobactrum sediminis]|uniref:IS3 family transposase n=1 Tax=Kineobactrum sediminis TaxID=1905677 RepID=UPI00240908FB|nr:IS3 family transposase [Kineobactrum sediminis]